MGIHAVWDDVEQSIIRWDFDPEWDWNDFWNAFTESMRMTQGFTRRVDIISNVSNTKRLPIGALGAFKTLDNKKPDFVQLTVVAGSNTISGVVIKTFGQLNRIDSWRTTTTVEEARALIQSHRQKNPT